MTGLRLLKVGAPELKTSAVLESVAAWRLQSVTGLTARIDQWIGAVRSAGLRWSAGERLRSAGELTAAGGR